MLQFKQGQIVEDCHGVRHEIVLIRGEWAWVQRTGFDRPETIRLSHLSERFKPVPLFVVGDRVKHHVEHTNDHPSGVGTVLAFHDDRVWVKFDKHAVPLSPLVSHLKKVA